MQITDFTGAVTTPSDSGWDEARQAFNLAVDQRPEAVLRPTSAADVAAAVRYAAAEGLGVAPQSTGHNAGALPLENALLLKTSDMNEIEIDPEAKRARVGAGARWGPVVEAASKHGLAALHGSSGTVGVAGYSLMGGIGWYARSRGLQCNAVTAIEMVDASGEERRVDSGSDPELFWALRGGGGCFGVVTALEFDLFELSEVFAGVLMLDWEHSQELLTTWHGLTAEWPDEITTSFRILQVPDIPDVPDLVRGRKLTIVDGAFTGPAEEGEKLIEPLRGIGEPIMDSWGTVPAATLQFLHMDPPDPVPGVSDSRLLGALDDATLSKLVEAAGPGSESPMTSVELRHIGGAVGRAPEGAGALDRLDGEFAWFTVGAAMTPEMGETIRGYLPRLIDVVGGSVSERSRYLCFSEMTNAVADAFDAATVERLAKVKAELDPDGLIRAGHAP